MGKDMVGRDRGLFETLSQNSPGGTEENAVRIVGVPAKIQTEQFPNMNLERRFESQTGHCLS
jgi:hypothetical protein